MKLSQDFYYDPHNNVRFWDEILERKAKNIKIDVHTLSKNICELDEYDPTS